MQKQSIIEDNAVFANILNVLVFNGEDLVKPEDIRDVEADTSDIGDMGTAKFVSGANTIVNIFLVQEEADKREAVMRAMLAESSEYSWENAYQEDEMYPVVSIALYFGYDHWNENRRLSDYIGKPDGPCAELFQDFELRNVYEMPYLSNEKIGQLKSPFREMVEYYQRTAIGKDPDRISIRCFDKAYAVGFAQGWIEKEKEKPYKYC